LLPLWTAFGKRVSKLIGTGILIILTGGAIHIFANEALYLQDEGVMTQLKNAWVAESFIKSVVLLVHYSAEFLQSFSAKREPE
jgi:hypothetical protein